jgi:hypothetical protein
VAVHGDAHVAADAVAVPLVDFFSHPGPLRQRMLGLAVSGEPRAVRFFACLLPFNQILHTLVSILMLFLRKT